MACATPPIDLYPMTWLGLIAFAWILEDDSPPPSLRPRLRAVLHGGLRGLVFGFGANVVALRFVAPVVPRFLGLPSFTGPIALLVVSAFEASRWVGAALVFEWLERLRVPSVFAFSLGVFSGTFIPTMLPWTVACGVCPWPATVQLAEIVGERGVAMLIALEAALVAKGIRCLIGSAFDPRSGVKLAIPGGWRSAVVALGSALALVFGSLGEGAIRIEQIERRRSASPAASIALVQPAVEATMRWDASRAHEILARLTELTLRAEHAGAALVVWPEAAYPFYLDHISRRAPIGAEAILQPGVRGPILTGVVMVGTLGKYNSTVIATNDGSISLPYDKMHLMWFGEMVPFGSVFPWLRQTFARGTGLNAGDHSVALDSGNVRAAVLNCLEDILPAAGREAMNVRPNLLVNVTNDAWFEGSAESDLHLRLARLRSVEVRRDLVRAVNMGPTTWIDAAGRLRARIPSYDPGILIAHPALLDAPMTIYARYGDLPLALTSAAYVFAAAATGRSRGRPGMLKGKRGR
jgi:apolipoprotein N-acyltransferase